MNSGCSVEGLISSGPSASDEDVDPVLTPDPDLFKELA
jgi:hypothetical protein